MKKLTLMTGILGCILSATSFAEKQAIDQIVAVVNDDVVTRSELDIALTAAKMQIAQEHITPPSEKMFRNQVLDQLINKKVQLQIAKQAGIHIDQRDVNESIAHVAEQNNMTVADLYQHLGQEGMSKATYINEIRDQITIQKLQQQEVASRIIISPDEIDSFMRSTSWKSNSGKEYRLDDLLVPVSDTPTTNELNSARKRAMEIAAQIKNGGNYQKVATAEANHGLQGGDLGWRKLPEIPSAFADPIARMKANDIAGPIQTQNGFHIIHLAEVRSTGAPSEDASASRKQVEQLLMQRKFEEAMQHWVSKIRGQSFIETKTFA